VARKSGVFGAVERDLVREQRARVAEFLTPGWIAGDYAGRRREIAGDARMPGKRAPRRQAVRTVSFLEPQSGQQSRVSLRS